MKYGASIPWRNSLNSLAKEPQIVMLLLVENAKVVVPGAVRSKCRKG